jgi:hypothetical protein
MQQTHAESLPRLSECAVQQTNNSVFTEERLQPAVTIQQG